MHYKFYNHIHVLKVWTRLGSFNHLWVSCIYIQRKVQIASNKFPIDFSSRILVYSIKSSKLAHWNVPFYERFWVWVPNKSAEVGRIFCNGYLTPFIRRSAFLTFACKNKSIEIAGSIFAKKEFYIDLTLTSYYGFLGRNPKGRTNLPIENPPKRWRLDFFSTFNLNFYRVSYA